MKAIVADPKLVAYCGLYCGACRAYREGRCRGCEGNEKATWCKVRACCKENGTASCADCATHPDPTDCRKFHSLFSRVIGFVLRSDRPACIRRIKEIGPEAYAAEMAQKGAQTIRK